MRSYLADVSASFHDLRGSAVVLVVYGGLVLLTWWGFVKLPSGWKFIGKLDAEQMRHLPSGTLTSLLPPDPERDATRFADNSKAKAKASATSASTTSR